MGLWYGCGGSGIYELEEMQLYTDYFEYWYFLIDDVTGSKQEWNGHARDYLLYDLSKMAETPGKEVVPGI